MLFRSVAVGLVGAKLLFRASFPEIEVPEAITIVMVAMVFTWGFSKRKEAKEL